MKITKTDIILARTTLISYAVFFFYYTASIEALLADMASIVGFVAMLILSCRVGFQVVVEKPFIPTQNEIKEKTSQE